MNKEKEFVLDFAEQADFMAKKTGYSKDDIEKWMDAEEEYLFEHGHIFIPGDNCTEEELQEMIDNQEQYQMDLDCDDMVRYIVTSTDLSEECAYALLDAEYDYECVIGLSQG